MEAWLSPDAGFDLRSRRVSVFGPGDEPVSWIAAADVAQFVAEAVRCPGVGPSVLELGGPDALSPLEVVAQAEAIGGRAIDVERVPPEELPEAAGAARDDVEMSIAAVRRFVARGDVVPAAAWPGRFAIGPTHVRDYLRGML
jgi:uncharacterized protein YbjT (DUF2867 family)